MNKSILEKLFIVFSNIFLPSKQFHESLQLTAKLTPFSHQFCIHFIAFLLQSLSFSFTTEFLDFSLIHSRAVDETKERSSLIRSFFSNYINLLRNKTFTTPNRFHNQSRTDFQPNQTTDQFIQFQIIYEIEILPLSAYQYELLLRFLAN